MTDDIAKQRLGKGLAALIGDLEAPEITTSSGQSPNSIMPSDREVPIELLRPNPNNPRQIFLEDELRDLANSVARHGIIQPILVRLLSHPPEQDHFAGKEYEIIAGERRWRAAQRAGIAKVPILLRDVGDRQALELAIIENVQRSDLNAMDEAFGYQQLIREHNYNQMELGQVIGKSRSHVTNTLRLLKLPAIVRGMVSEALLSAGHARALVTANDPETLAKMIVKKGLSVRQAEALVKVPKKESPYGTKPKLVWVKAADTLALEKRLEGVLGLKISINHRSNDSGTFRIQYQNLEQLDEICRRLEKN